MLFGKGAFYDPIPWHKAVKNGMLVDLLFELHCRRHNPKEGGESFIF
jgi:hypothetical protein